MNICGRKEQIFAKKFEPFVNPYVITKIKQTITQKKKWLWQWILKLKEKIEIEKHYVIELRMETQKVSKETPTHATNGSSTQIGNPAHRGGHELDPKQ